jgi:hypothetical protein
MEDEYFNKLIECVLLNACSVNSTDLKNGKSGISLCLFEIARYLHNEDIEDKAFQLLQESLSLYRNKNSHFKSKPIDIGFLLLYLIENKFIDADFNDLFEEDADKILIAIQNLGSYSEKHLIFVGFLDLFFHVRANLITKNIRDKILDDTANSLEQQFSKFRSINSHVLKINVLYVFESYLKIAYCCTNYIVPTSLLNVYVDLYRHGKLANSFCVGYYLGKRASNFSDEALTVIAQKNKQYAIQNIYPNQLTLSQQIGYLYLLNEDKVDYTKQINLLESDLFGFSNTEYEKNISRKIPLNSLMSGYQEGIARLLLYKVYRENKLHNQDSLRFKYLF